MNKDELKNLLASNENIAIVDVRSNEERAQISIPKTLHIPMDELPSKLETLKKFDEVYFFCKAGGRARTACKLGKDSGLNAFAITNSIFEIAEYCQ